MIKYTIMSCYEENDKPQAKEIIVFESSAKSALQKAARFITDNTVSLYISQEEPADMYEVDIYDGDTLVHTLNFMATCKEEAVAFARYIVKDSLDVKE